MSFHTSIGDHVIAIMARAKERGPMRADAAPAPVPVPQTESWPEPQPLPSGQLPVEPFDAAILPDRIRPWVMDIAERFQCPPDYVAAAAMTALGAVIGLKVAVRPKQFDDWAVTANFWALVVGRPGTMKSPAVQEALKPLKQLVAQAKTEYMAAEVAHKAGAMAAKLRGEEMAKRAKKTLATDPEADVSHLLIQYETEDPVLRRYMVGDSNAASLGEVHRQNPNGIMVYQDEMMALLRSLSREDQAEARGFYLTGWNGNSSYTFDRIGRGLNLHIPSVCLSLLGGTQPGRFADHVRHAVSGGAADDGMLQRFGLLVWPSLSGEWRNVDRSPDAAAKCQAYAVFERLDSMTAEAVGARQDLHKDTGTPDGPPYLRLEPAAAELFLEWRTNLETRLRSDEMHPALESHLSKYRKLVPGLALVDHLADCGRGDIGEQSMRRALAWAEYLETHARRVYGLATQPAVDAAKAILSRIRKGDLPPRFGSREVWRPGWTGLSDRHIVTEALSLLVEFDWLSETIEATPGRRRTIYAANPRVA